MLSISFIILSLVYFCNAEDYLELNKNNFETTLNGLDLTLVKFYAEWCGHCKRMAPEFSKASTHLLKNDPPIQLIKVNCPDNEDLCQKFGISGYPTLKVFRRGKFLYDYDGPRDGMGIVEYMISRAGPPTIEINNEEQLTGHLNSTKTVFLGLFKNSNENFFQKFSEVAGTLFSDFKFLHSFNENLHKKYSLSNEQGIIRILPLKYQSKLEEPFLIYDGPTNDANSIKSWIEKNWAGNLAVKNANNVKLLLNKPMVTIFYNIDYERNLKGTNYVRNRLLKVIKKQKELKTKLKFSMASMKEFNYELNNFGIEDITMKQEPIVTVLDENDKKYLMPITSNKFNYEEMNDFLNKVVAEQIEPYIKSEPIPTNDSNDEAVKKIVAKNFDQIVNDPTKEVLIEFYAPWCGHCKSLKPIYEELAKKFKDESNLIIAAMDATANDIPPQFTVNGFPTIYWVPKNAKNKPILYSGAREIENFVSFIKENAVTLTNEYSAKGIKTEL